MRQVIQDIVKILKCPLAVGDLLSSLDGGWIFLKQALEDALIRLVDLEELVESAGQERAYFAVLVLDAE